MATLTAPNTFECAIKPDKTALSNSRDQSLGSRLGLRGLSKILANMHGALAGHFRGTFPESFSFVTTFFQTPSISA